MNQKVDWEKVDWNLQDIVISERFGITRERVRQVRKLRGFVCSESRHRRGVNKRDLILGSDTAGKGISEIALEFGCKESYVRCVLNRSGKEYNRIDCRSGNSKYDWGLFPDNYRKLTDKDIARIIGISNPSIVTQWRIRHGKKKGVS